ncbi:uncharacterized protein LOC111694633 [Trichogramma pretiosum]|uniref:uncharacterized protein LOC111694633 n=1 Tax=Trichogramma pretiosum TaxID=7493 RepID=UPI000C718F61|nr:uncharacterized protein LOC111694633 [Trichogramma pretiosum]
MPAIALTSDDEIFDVLKQHPEIFDNNGNLTKERHPQWKIIIQKLPKINVHNLYVRVQQNRTSNKKKNNGIQDRLKAFFSYNQDKSIQITESKYVEECRDNENTFETTNTLDNSNQQEECFYIDQFDAIHAMKYNVKYFGMINSISSNKLEIIYFSKEQLDLLKKVITSETSLSIILLNEIIEKTRMKSHISEKLSKIYLCSELGNESIPFAQALTESMNEIFIQNFLLRILKFNVPLPKYIIVTYDQALIDGICLALNQCPFEEYNFKCFKNCEPPKVNLCVDVISILIAVDHFECFIDKPDLAKEFYINCVILLSLCVNQVDFDEKLKSIFTIMFSPDENTCKDILESEFKKNEEKFKCFESYRNNESLNKILYTKHIAVEKEKCEVIHYIDSIKESVLAMHNSNSSKKELNGYYLPQLYDELIVILRLFPSWTKIICPIDFFDSASSPASKTVKKLQELDCMPLQVTKYLEYDIQDIKLLLQKGRLIRLKSKAAQKETIQYENHYCLAYEETWMGLKNPNDKDNIDVEEKLPATLDSEESNKNIDESSVVNESIAIEIEGSNKNIDESSVMNESIAMEIEESNKNIVESSVVDESIAMEIEESKQDRLSPMVIKSKSNSVDLETQSGNTLQNVQFLNYIQARKPLKTKKLNKFKKKKVNT